MSSTPPSRSQTRPAAPLLSIVVPCFNEEGCVDEMLRRLLAVLGPLGCRWEVILVDDGSRDGTLEAIQRHAQTDSRIGYVSFSRNFGHQMALWAGMERARGDAVVSLDGDLQHPPELIPELFEKWLAGFDVVYTVRQGTDGRPYKEVVSSSFYWILRKMTGVEIPTGGADYRLLDRRVADALLACDERFIFVRGLVPWLGFKRTSVTFRAAERYAGDTKYVVTRMLKFALDGIFSFSTVPLRLISFLGVATIGLGILYGLYSIGVRFFTESAATGWTSLVVLVLVFSGTQLLSLGILSEYVGRIYDEVKRRPRYIVADAQQPAPQSQSQEASP